VKHQSRDYVYLLLTIGFGVLAAVLFTGCSGSWLPATRQYVDEIAVQTADSAATNPISATFAWVSSILGAMTGTTYLSRRRRADPKANAKRQADINGQ